MLLPVWVCYNMHVGVRRQSSGVTSCLLWVLRIKPRLSGVAVGSFNPLSHLGSSSTLPKTIQTSGSDRADKEINHCHHLLLTLNRPSLLHADTAIY